MSLSSPCRWPAAVERFGAALEQTPARVHIGPPDRAPLPVALESRISATLDAG